MCENKEFFIWNNSVSINDDFRWFARGFQRWLCFWSLTGAEVCDACTFAATAWSWNRTGRATSIGPTNSINGCVTQHEVTNRQRSKSEFSSVVLRGSFSQIGNSSHLSSMSKSIRISNFYARHNKFLVRSQIIGSCMKTARKVCTVMNLAELNPTSSQLLALRNCTKIFVRT